ncbi:hypothetical protein D3C86_1747110 [compost metagenome]
MDQIEQIRLDPLDIVVTHAYLDARQAELAIERTAPAGLKINDPLAEIRQIVCKPVRSRQHVKITLRTRRIDNQLLAFAVGSPVDKMELTVIPQLLQQMVKGLLPVPIHDKINACFPLHPIERLVRNLRPP